MRNELEVVSETSEVEQELPREIKGLVSHFGSNKALAGTKCTSAWLVKHLCEQYFSLDPHPLRSTKEFFITTTIVTCVTNFRR